ncbi:MAG: alpha/beta fold hydrolase, partial [Pseudomonadota bacterium]
FHHLARRVSVMRRFLKRLLIFVAAVLLLLYFGVWHMAQYPPGPGDLSWQNLVMDKGWSKFMDMGHYQVHYLEAGRGAPLLLIHGFADSSYSWQRNFEALAEAGFRVLALDLPGLGRSEAPPGFSFTPEAMAAVILEFLDRKNIPRVHLIGNSLGGHLTLFLAVEHSERVNKIVPVDPACYPFDRHRFLGPAARNRALSELAKPLIGPWVFHFTFKRCFYDPGLATEAMISQRSRPFLRPDFKDNLIKLGGAYFSTTFAELSGKYRKITAPTLIVWGDADRMIPAKGFAVRLQKDIPGSRLVIIEKAGHLPHTERPETFNRLVVEFLRQG